MIDEIDHQTGGALITVPVATLGPVRHPRTASGTYPHFTDAYTKLAQVVRESGLMRRARWFYAAVGIVLALAFGGAITGFVLFGASWFQLLIAAVFGILFTQVAFLAHEAGHKQIFASGKNNERLARILAVGVVGISYSWWTSKHTRHHGNPNRIGKDPDIDMDTVSFIEEDAAKSRGVIKWITKRQGWLFFPLLTLEGINLHRLGFQHLFSKGKVEKRWTELGLVFLRFGVVLIPVFWFLPLGMAFAFMGVMLAVFGVYMGASFAPNHKGMPIVEADAKLDFFTKQVRTSRNVSGGWASTIFMGGLNFQIEHHLFPSMARPYLARASEIVREHCRTLNVPYTETTILQSYAIVIRYLNEVGLAAGDPFDCPEVARFRQA